MSRRAATFRQADVVRAVKAARAAGIVPSRIEIAPDGRIVVSELAEPAKEPGSEFDRWKASRQAGRTG